jgi:hypothetical protein
MNWQPVSFLSQINSLYIFIFCFIKIYFDYYIPHYARIYRFAFSFMFTCLNFIFISRQFHACCTSCPLNPHWFGLPNNIYLKLKSSLCNYLCPLLTATSVSSSILGSEALGASRENPEERFLTQSETFCTFRTPFTLPSEISRFILLKRAVVKFAQ